MSDHWRAASLVYRCLLRVYPRTFHNAYAGEMAATFDARLMKTRNSAGRLRALAFCLTNYLDTLRTAAAEWTAQSTPAASSGRLTGGWRLDLRHAWRSIIARPSFSLVVVLTLALAIGANTAMFSVLQAVLLDPVPFREPDRIAVLGERSSSIDTQFVSPITYDDWQTRNEAFEDLAAFRYWETVNLEDTVAEPESIKLVAATANLFAVLGVQPILGVTYKDEPNAPSGSEAVISYELWQRRYGGRASVLGRPIHVRGNATTIVGVLPRAGLNLSLGWGDVAICLHRYNVQKQRASSYRDRYLSVVGRLRPDLSLDQARVRMDTLQHQLWRESTSVASGYEVRLVPVADALAGGVRLTLLALAWALALVLLIACANIANLMLMRAAVRQRDTAVRLALGAGPRHLLQLLLAESLSLAALGGLAGVVLAHEALVGLKQFRPDIPRLANAAITPRVLGFTAAVAVGAAVLFSLAPMLDLRRANLRDALNASGRGGSAGGGARLARHLLVGCQMGLACVLLISGGLLFRSLENLLRVDPGFRPRNAVLFDLYLPTSRYPGEPDHTRFYRDLTRELSETPGLQSAGALLYFPYKPKLWLSSIWIDGMPMADGEEPVVYYNLAASDYFQSMGIPLRAGRWPTAREMWDQPRAVVVNEALARQLFPGGAALGRQIRTARTGPWREIVGIAGNVRQRRLDEAAKPEIYETFSEMPMPFMTVIVRTTGAPEPMLDVVRGVVRRHDAGLAVANLMTLDSYLDAHTSDRRFALTLFATFAALAVGLGAVGIYGVMSYSVAQRQREIAIRLALGAVPGGVRSMVVRDALRVVLAGAVVGLAASAVAGRFISALLFGVGAIDPLTYAAVPAALVLVAVIASWIPARRASRVDAIGSLRGE